ncbi:unnamed protein product [Camellia sinensis]
MWVPTKPAAPVTRMEKPWVDVAIDEQICVRQRRVQKWICGAGLETGVAEGVPVQPILQGRQANTLDHDGYRIAERGGVKVCVKNSSGQQWQSCRPAARR